MNVMGALFSGVAFFVDGRSYERTGVWPPGILLAAAVSSSITGDHS